MAGEARAQNKVLLVDWRPGPEQEVRAATAMALAALGLDDAVVPPRSIRIDKACGRGMPPMFRVWVEEDVLGERT